MAKRRKRAEAPLLTVKVFSNPKLQRLGESVEAVIACHQTAGQLVAELRDTIRNASKVLADLQVALESARKPARRRSPAKPAANPPEPEPQAGEEQPS